LLLPAAAAAAARLLPAAGGALSTLSTAAALGLYSASGAALGGGGGERAVALMSSVMTFRGARAVRATAAAFVGGGCQWCASSRAGGEARAGPARSLACSLARKHPARPAVTLQHHRTFWGSVCSMHAAAL
jgi:hypothetical protein